MYLKGDIIHRPNSSGLGIEYRRQMVNRQYGSIGHRESPCGLFRYVWSMRVTGSNARSDFMASSVSS